MDLKFIYSGAAYSIDSILEFTKEGLNEFWCEPFFHFYPDIDRAAYCALNTAQRREFLRDYFTAFADQNRTLLDDKLVKYNNHWTEHRQQVIEALEDAFSLDLTGLFDDMRSEISFNPISPRYLDRNTFDTFYLQSERGALGSALHEIIHFVWFYVWHQQFHDSTVEYETPHLKWILSEMVVEPIMRDERLASINPYFADGGCVYPYFYTLKIGERPILDRLYEMYKTLPITTFMQESYLLCQQHVIEIRAHIDASESM